MPSRPDPTTTGAGREPCLECGRTGCGEAFGRLIALELQGVEPYAAFHTITVSAHYLQHPSLGTEGRPDWWGFLDVFLDEGLYAVARIAESRRAANAAGRPIPPVVASSGRDVPAVVGTEVTALEVIGSGSDPLPASTHEQRMEAWVRSIMG